MKLTATLLAFTLSAIACIACIACTEAKPPTRPLDPRDIDGPVDCAAQESKANEKCFAKAEEACESLGCAEGCDIHRSRTSRWVTCAVSRAHASMPNRCGGYSNWQCPEGTVCSQDPRPGSCRIDKDDDCIGVCVSARP